MKKICLIHHTGELGGGSKSLLDIAEMLNDVSDLIICIPEGDTKLKRVIQKKGYKYYPIHSPIPQYPFYSGGPKLMSRTMVKLLSNIFYIRPFCKELERLQPDVIIFNSIVTIASAPFFNSEIKKICFVRETIVNKIAIIFFKKILDKYIQKVCFLSEWDKHMLSANEGRSVVIPDCVDESTVILHNRDLFCKTENISKEKFLVLYMGGDDPIKGPDVIFEAMSLLDDRFFLLAAGNFIDNRNYKWWKIRNNMYYKKLEQYKCKLENDNRVKFYGYIQDISELMSICDIVVFPSNYVHQSRPAIEAGFYKKPVIISDFEQTKEYFIDGFNAITFSPRNSKQLAKKLLYALENTSIVDLISKNNYTMSKEFHDFNKIQLKLLEFINSILVE